MKKINTILCLLGLSCMFVACQRDMMTYQGTESVWFAVQNGDSWGSVNSWPYVPFTNVEFVKTTSNQVNVNILVRATGATCDHARTIDFKVLTEKSNGVQGTHFDLSGNSVELPAGAVETTIPVTVYRTPDMQKDTVKICLQLVENQDFSLIFRSWENPKDLTTGDIYEGYDASCHTIVCTDILAQPAVWLGSIKDGMDFNTFGGFTPKKFRLIQEVMGYTYEDFMSSETMTYGVQYAIGRYMSNYLVQMYNARTPVLEEDGRLMYFGNCPWTSYEGVPWDGVFVEY